MTKHDRYFSLIIIVKGLPDPQEIFWILFCQWNARSDACMNQQDGGSTGAFVRRKFHIQGKRIQGR
jgi:hypothetical protein